MARFFVYYRFAMKLSENGLVAHLKKKYIPPSDQCRVDKIPDAKLEAVKLNELTIVYLILGVGLTLSILSFLLEIVIAKRLKK